MKDEKKISIYLLIIIFRTIYILIVNTIVLISSIFLWIRLDIEVLDRMLSSTAFFEWISDSSNLTLRTSPILKLDSGPEKYKKRRKEYTKKMLHIRVDHKSIVRVGAG